MHDTLSCVHSAGSLEPYGSQKPCVAGIIITRYFLAVEVQALHVAGALWTLELSPGEVAGKVLSIGGGLRADYGASRGAPEVDQYGCA